MQWEFVAKSKPGTFSDLLDVFLPAGNWAEFWFAWVNARCPPKPAYHSSSSNGQGRGNMMKGLRAETRTGRDHSPITITDKTD